jgi:hypothetical protein
MLKIAEFGKTMHKIPHGLVIGMENMGPIGVNGNPRFIPGVVAMSGDMSMFFDHQNLAALFGQNTCRGAAGKPGTNNKSFEVFHRSSLDNTNHKSRADPAHKIFHKKCLRAVTKNLYS